MSLLTIEGRSEAVTRAAAGFEIDHLVNPDERQIGMAFARLAQEVIMRVRMDTPELLKALSALQDARDKAIKARSAQQFINAG